MVTLDSLDLQKLTPEEIGEILVTAKKAYYTGGKPIMDDHTYDTLEEILKQKNPHHRLFSKVGHPNFDTGFAKKNHVMPMGSQNKVTNFADLVHYFLLKKISPSLSKEGAWGWIVQPKCDGISLEIEYKNGQLVDTITRGDGVVGDIITQNVVKMKNFVLSPQNFTGSVRCEIVVTKKDFAKLNQVGDEKYSNPRNAASGLSQRLDSKYSDFCSLYAVDILVETPRRDVSSENDKINLLNKLGFTTVESTLCTNFDAIEKIYQEFISSKRDSYSYEIDGLVIKINDLNIAQELGSLNNRPKHQVAYKFPASTDTTQIKNVVWQVGPLGNITPVAEVEPIELSGAIISFASLANYDLIKKMDLNIGDIVKISRRGDVIPHIEEVVTKVNPGHLIAPTHCPDCQTLLTVEDKFLKCPNPQNCLSQILGCLQLFCQTLDILGLSDKTITKLYSANKIRFPGDFYKLEIADIANLDNLGDKSAKNILHQIQAKKSLTLVEVFDAAIIPNFSKKRIQQLIDAGFDTPEKLLNITTADIEPLFGFQITLAQKIVAGMTLRRSWIASILSQTKITDSGLRVTNSKLKRLSFCITGDLSVPRKQLEQTIIDNGGTVQSTVSKNTTYLITNETSSNSSKFVTAQKLGTKIITESKFSSLLA